MAQLKNIVILGLALISMIAAESMLRTDDFDLAYLSDSEEIKSDATPVKADPLPAPTANACGLDTAAAATKDNCTGDFHNRCCLATYTAADTTAKAFCVLATDKNYKTQATTAQSDLVAAYATSPVIAFTCADHNKFPGVTDTCNKASVVAPAQPKSIDDCDTSATNNASRCCFVVVTSGDAPGNYCLKSGKSVRTDAANVWNADADLKFVSNAVCGVDTNAATVGDCFGELAGDAKKSAPTDPKDCWRSLKGKCCQVSFNADGSKPICLLADGVSRAGSDTDGSNRIQNIYGASVLPANIKCQASGTAFDNTCGLQNDGKTKFAVGVNATDKLNCTSDKTDVCCQATSADKFQKRCVKSNIAKKDSNSTSAGNATLNIEDTYTDLSEVVCSSTFVKASVAIVAIVLALF